MAGKKAMFSDAQRRLMKARAIGRNQTKLDEIDPRRGRYGQTSSKRPVRMPVIGAGKEENENG